MTHIDEEVAELSADQLAELLGDAAHSSRITVGISVKKSADLPPAAHDIAEFIGILREQTGTDFVLDVQAAINADGSAGQRLTGAIGFMPERGVEEAEDDEEGGEDHGTHKRSYR